MTILNPRWHWGSSVRPIDNKQSSHDIYSCQTTPAGESDSVSAAIGAEGATAPETLRFKDRRGMTLWKATPHCGVHRRA